MLDVERWAEIRRMHFVERLSIRAIARRTGHDRKTAQSALRSDAPPRHSRPPRGSKLDPYREEIDRLLRADPRLPGTRIRELLQEQGYAAPRRSSATTCASCARATCPRPRTFQRTDYRPGEILQFDLFELRREVPVGHGRTRKGWVVLAELGYSRASAGGLIFSKEAPDILWALSRSLKRLGGLPKLLVTDREGSLHAGGGRPSEPFARFCGELRCGWLILDRGDCQAKGLIENGGRYLRTNLEPGRVFANELDLQDQLDGSCEKANGRSHRGIRCCPLDRLAEEHAALAALPERLPDTDRWFVIRVAPQPYLRFDTCDYSLDPRLVGRRVEVSVSQCELLAVALDSGELAARHRGSFARHRTLTAPEHARARRELRSERRSPGVEVEARPLSRYDALIPA